MRFIREIISEKRRTAASDMADSGSPEADRLYPDAMPTRAWDEASLRPGAPLQLDAYALRQDRIEEAPQPADAMAFDDPDEDFVEDMPDPVDAEETAFLDGLTRDADRFDEAEAPVTAQEEEDLPDLDIFGRSDMNPAFDPFTRLARERAEQGTVSPDLHSMDGDGNADADLGLFVVGQAPQPDATPGSDGEEAASFAVPAPALGRGASRSGRVKTRLLGFSAGSLEQADVFDETRGVAGNSFPVGWLVVVSELGRGACFALRDGVSKVGRGTDQTVCLNFGDNSISRDNHLSIAYDAEQNKFYIGQSGKSNLVRLNNKPLLSTEELVSRDQIRLGETTLRFIALCENDFTWQSPDEKARKHA